MVSHYYGEYTVAIIVDKVQKRKDIAMACKDLFIQNGINDLTVSQVAKTAGVGKGTIYEYFKNKEEIVLEIVSILMQNRNLLKEEKISKATSTKEKVKLFFDFFYNDEDIELRQIYREFLSISLTNPDIQMIEFNTNVYKNYMNWVENIIQEGIDNAEISSNSKSLIQGLFAHNQGVFLISISTNIIENIQHDINGYIDNIFELIEVKND